MESKHLNCTPEVTRYVYIFQVKQERHFSASCLKVAQSLTVSERFYSRKSFVMRFVVSMKSNHPTGAILFHAVIYITALLVRVYLPRNSRLLKTGHL